MKSFRTFFVGALCAAVVGFSSSLKAEGTGLIAINFNARAQQVSQSGSVTSSGSENNWVVDNDSGALDYVIPAAAWLQLEGRQDWGTKETATVYDYETQQSDSSRTAKVGWNAANIWAWTGCTAKILNGYLDDSNDGATVTVTEIPFAKYDVIFYAATDADKQFGAPEINGKRYTYASGETVEGDAAWGSSQSTTAAYGTNALRVNGLSGDLTVKGYGNNNAGYRGGIAALVIVEGEVEEVVTKEYTYNGFLTTQFADTGWKFDLNKITSATITGTMSGRSIANPPVDSTGYWVEGPDSDGIATFQMQVYQYNKSDDHWLKAVKVELKQGTNGNIWIRGAGAMHVDGGLTDPKGSIKITEWKDSLATSATTQMYGVASVKIVVNDDEPYDGPVADAVWVGEDLNGATKDAYSLNLNGNSYANGAITISGNNGVLIDWDTASTGPFTVIVKYENLNLNSSSEQVLATVKDGNYADHVGVHLQARNANYVKGIWQNNTWRNTNTKVAEEPMPSASGIFTLGYKRDGGTQLFYQSAEGDEAEKVYEYTGLNSRGSTYSGVAIGGKRGGGWAASDMKITAIALFTGKRLTEEELAAYRFPEPVVNEFVFENTDCGADSTKGYGDYIPTSLTIPESVDLPAGTKLRIKSITFAQQTGYDWNYSAEFLTLNGVKSDSRNGNSQTLESWSIGDKLEYVFSNDAVITVGEAASLGLDQGNGTYGNVRIRLFKTTAAEYGYIRLNDSMDQWRPAYKIVAERYVPVSGAACLYDWTFTNTVTSVGKNAGTLNWDTNSGDGAKYASTRFFADVNYKYGAALNLQATPYANFDVKYGTSWSTATIGIMPNVAKCIFVTLGTKANHLGLARGENENEVWVIGNGAKLDSFMVDDAETVSHVYVMALEGGTLCVFVDGTLKSTVKTAITIANKFQIGSAHGGAPAGFQRADQDAVSNGASVQALRIYDHVLSAGEMSALKNEFYVAPPPPRDPTTIYWKGGDGTIDGSTTFEDEDGNEVKYISGDEIVIDGTCNVTLARSVGELHVANGAVLQIGSAGNVTTKLYIDEGGTFDVNGVQDKTYPIVLNGGTLANYGTAVGDGKAQFWNLEVAADSFIDAENDFGTIASKYGSQEFKLGGNKLTKLGAGKFFIAEATFTGGGTLDIQEGTIVLRNGATLPNNLTVKVGPNGETISGGTGFAIKSGKIIFDISRMIDKQTEITLLTAANQAAEKFALADGTDENWEIQIDETSVKAVNAYKLLKLDGVAYPTLEMAFANMKTDGAVMEIVDTERLAYAEGVLTLDGEAVDLAKYAVELVEGEAGAITVNLAMAEGASLIITEVMPKSTDAVNHGALESYDINGLASGWVEVKNTSDKWVDLKDYKFIRVNRSKANSKGDYGNFPSRLVAPNSLAIFYTSERYANSADMSVSAFATPVDAKKPHVFTELNDVLVWPDKVNPKTFPFVRLYYAPNGEEEEIVDTIVIPSDLPEGMSIIVEPVKENEATVRYICEAPTRGEENPSTDGLVKLGPNVGPLYEVAGVDKKGNPVIGAAHNTASEFDAPVAMAVAGEDYEITFALNPTMSPTEAVAFREEDEITGIKLIYRKDLDDATLDETVVDLEAKATDAADMGDTYKVSIPSDYFPAAGHLIQWKFEINDAAGNTWTSPSYHNKDDGYEWYGTIVKPTEGQESSTLTTWHMFADAGSVQQMDVDADKQNLAVVPNNARVAIYDSSTSNYYDYVRIDLRGNTTASFHKKSHGLRFAKAHPLTMKDVVTGETVKEIRKSSLIAEYSDPSFLRQVLAFWLFNRNGSPAPFDFPVRCNLNGEFFELGFHSERFTDELIEDIYGLDKFGYGYKNIGSFGNGTSAGGIEKKTPDDEDEKNLTVLNAFCNLLPNYEVKTDADRTKYTKVVVEKMDLPAWLNYIALSKITQEMDDVWANLSGYLDDPAMLEGHRGTGTWMPLAYDMNTSLGVWYKEVSFPQGGPMAKEDWFKSHPFYGGYALPAHSSAASTAPFGRQNRAYEAIFQNEKFRRLYLRRLRTLMDAELGEPDVAETFETCEVPLVVKMRELIPLISADAVLDRAKWGYGTGTAIDVWGAANFPKTVELGAEDLYANFIVPRRKHLYVTHSIDAANVGYGTEYSAGIPHAQSAIEDLKGGFSAEIVSGGVVIRNANDEAIDLSGWKVSGPISMTLPAGTVIDQKVDNKDGELFVVVDRRQYVADNTSTLTDEVIIGNAEAGDEANPIGLTSPDGINVFAIEKSEQELYLRLWGFAGAPNGAEGTDANEFIVFTNLNQEASLDASGAHIQFEKYGATPEGRCSFDLPAETIIEAGGWVRFNQADIPWTKITDGFQEIVLTDANGIEIERFSNLDQSTIIGGKGSGKMAVHNLETDEWYAILITEAPGYEPPPPPPPMPLTWADTNVTELVTLPAGYNYSFANVNFEGGLAFEPGEYEIKNDGKDSVNSAAFVSAAGASITFVGKGRFELNGEDVTNSLFTAKDLYITKGTFAINTSNETAKVAAVSLTGNFGLSGEGKLEMNLTGNQPVGIELTNKKMNADFTAGSFTAVLDGTKASAFKFKGSDAVTLSGGTMDVVIEGTGAKVLNGGTIVFEDGYVCNIEGDKEAIDATVFEAGKTLTVNGGVFDISVPGAGSQIFTTADDPSEKDLTLTINGGEFNLLAGDDCVKSAGNDAVNDPESVNTARNVVINGGDFYGVSLGNDVIDSNGDIIITGGNILAYTTAIEDDNNGSTGLDVNKGRFIDVQGGNVIAIGGPNSSFHYAGGVAYTTDSVEAVNFSEKFLELTGSVNGQETHVWAKLPELKVETISLFAYTRGIDPFKAPTATTEAPSEEFATGFHDLYIDDLKPVNYNGGEALSQYATDNLSGTDGAIGWKGYAFAEPAMIVGVTVTSSDKKPLAIYGAAIQGANTEDFSDAEKIAWIEIDQYFKGGEFVVPLEDVHGPYKYVRIIGEIGANGADVVGLEFYGLKSSGELAPRSAPEVTASGSTDGKATFTIVADKYVPQVYRVERTMVAGDGDEEAFLPLGLVGGETFTWTDSEATPFTSYRVQGVNANGVSAWTTFTVEPKKVIAGGDLRPTFSVKPGAYAESQSLEIAYSDPTAEIWYTTDGSEPVNIETATCHKYTGAITLAERADAPANLGAIPTASEKFSKAHSSDGFRVPTANQPYVTTIRAKAFKEGAQSQYDAYGTWLIGKNATRHEGLRVVSLQTEKDNFFSDATGIMVPGDWYKSVDPSQITTWDGHPYANYFQTGRTWERKVNLELFEGDGSEGFNQQFGVRVRGNYTRAVPKKSMTVYGRAEYGVKNLKYNLFRDEMDHNKYKRFLLRSGGNVWNGALIKDGIAQRVFRGWLRTSTQGLEPSTLYINGEYWGLYNIRHAYSKKHFEDWCGVDGDNIDWIKIDPASNLHYDVQEGDLVEFVKMRDFLRNNDFTLDENWQKAKAMVDLDDMIDFHIVSMFVNCTDWIGNGNGNNAGYWRERKPDGKWHFHVFDCDETFNSASADRIATVMSRDDGQYSPPFFRKLSVNPEFQRMFVTRYADLLNTALKSERTQKLLSDLANEIRPEIERTVARWMNMGSVQNWENGIKGINTFFGQRPDYVWGHLKNDFPSITGNEHKLTLTKSGEGEIQLNTIESGEGAGKFALPFEGDYFELTPVTLTAKPAKGMMLEKWVVNGADGSTEPTIELALDSDTSVQAVFVEAPPPEVPMRWEGTNVVERVTLPPGDYEFANANFVGGIDLEEGDYKFKNDGGSSVNSIASLDGPLANVTFTGKGRMNIVGSGDKTLFAVQDLIISNGVFAIDFASAKEKTPAVTVARNFLLDDKGTVSIALSGIQPRGIELTNKKMNATFAGGTFAATLDGTKASAFKFKGSDAVTLSGGKMEVSMVGEDAKVFNGGTIVFKDGYDCKIIGEANAIDATAFVAGKTLTVDGGTFDINLPADGSEVFTTESDPTDPGSSVTINGGEITVVSGDDCVNAYTDIIINGGNFYGVSLKNDVIDANNNIIINGGNVLAYTTAVENDGNGSAGLDTNIGYTIRVNGGNVIAIGGPNSSFYDCGSNVWTNDNLVASEWSGKFVKLTGSVNGEETHIWAKLPELTVETISMLVFTPGMDPAAAPEATTETPPEEFATGFHDLYIQGAMPVVIPTRWENTNVTERIALPPGDYEFANVTFEGGLDLQAGDYKFKNDGSGSVNSIASLNGPLANVIFTGKGRMNITGEGASTLFAVQDLIISNGVFAVDFTSTVEEVAAVTVARNFLLDDKGKVAITLDGAKPRGIELSNKKMSADFAGGTFTATLKGTKASAFKFKGSDAVTLSGGTMDVTIEGTGAKVLNGGTIVFEDGYVCNIEGDEYATDATVFESGKTLTVNGGVFNISVPGAGSQIFTTTDDPSEKDLTLTINGGTFNLLAGDDCVKSAGNDAVSDPESVNTKRDVVINGGDFYGVSLGNDVIDSNGDIIITGGNILAYTTAVEDDGNGSTGLDVNEGRVIDIQGGNVIAIGGPNASFHYEEGVAFTANGLSAADWSGKFVKLDGKMGKFNTRVWAKLPELAVDEISLFVFTPGIDPTVMPTATSEAPSDEFATGFHDLYIDDVPPGELVITKICARCQPNVPEAKDLGWILLENMGGKSLELSNYKVYCVNRGKKLKPEEGFTLPEGTLDVGATFKVWTSESPIEVLPAEATPLYAKKINQKKYPMVQLYKADVVTQTVLVPVDLADELVYDAAADRRPTISPLYGVKDAPDPWQAFTQAKLGEGYSVTLPLLPADMSAADEDQIASAKLIYQIGFGPIQTNATEMTKSETKDKMNGWTYTGTIPGAALTNPGELVRFAVAITDNAGRTFRAPSFQNPDDGYEWYGTIVEPAEGMTDAKVQTFYLFADDASLKQMDVDVDKQDKSVVPYNARVGIYDALTGLYYDNVRIDLRGNTTARFPKKSHGLRFSKAQPLSCTDPVTGTVFEEIRKTSFVADYMDPAYIRQSLSFWLFREAGAKAPYDYPVKLNLNGEFYQLAWNSNRFTDELIEDVYGLDPLGYGFKNCGTIQPGHRSSITTEKKTPDDGVEVGDDALAKLYAFENSLPDRANYSTKTDDGENSAEYNAVVVNTFDLPAWLNYMAMTRITSETDDTWSNISLYYDINGTGTWMPLAYDCHLSFGAFFCHDTKEGVRANIDWFKSHPFYGGWRVPAFSKGLEAGGWGGKHMTMSDGGSASNSGLESIYQSPKFRRLYLRRLRTLMDTILEAPGTEQADSKLWSYIKLITDATADLAAADRAKWPLSDIYNFQNDSMNCWPNVASMTPTMGIEDLWNNYVEPRRIHLFETHSIHNTEKGVGYNNRLSAGIPDKQSELKLLRRKISAVYDDVIGAVVIKNANIETIDLSGFVLTGPVNWTLPSGTILDQATNGVDGELYVTADRRATVAAMTVVDQVVVGNGEIGDGAIELKAADGTVIIGEIPEEPVIVELIASRPDEELPATIVELLKNMPANTLVVLKGESEEDGFIVDYVGNFTFENLHLVVESGEHSFRRSNGGATTQFANGATPENPTILVKDGATLNLCARDLSGWNCAVDTMGVIRVADGGTLNLRDYSNNTFYFNQQFYLDAGADVHIYCRGDHFRLNGGVNEMMPQIYMPPSEGGVATITIESDSTGLKIAADSHPDAAFYIENGSTLIINGNVTGSGRSITKYGAGKLIITGTCEPILTQTLLAIDGAAFFDWDEALRHIQKDGSVLAILDESRMTFKAGMLTLDGKVIDLAALAIKITDEEGALIIKPDVGEGGTLLYITEIMPKPTDSQNRGTLEGMDPNGLESGWVELRNDGDKWVDLKDYRFVRINRKKATKPEEVNNFPSMLVAPHSFAVFYTSERYSNSADQTVSAFETGTFDGQPMILPPKLHGMMVWGDKVNPKKSPFVRLYYVPGGDLDNAEVIDTVIVPSDLPEGASIIVGRPEEGKSTARWICEAPTRGAENPSTDGLVRIGPNVGPLYEGKKQKKHDSDNEFARNAPPANPDEDYVVTFSANPVLAPTKDIGTVYRDEDKLASIVMVVRTDLDDNTLTEIPVDFATKDGSDTTDWGDTYTATIPKSKFPARGHLIQWKFKLVDKAGSEWMSPSYHNPDDGYEWYGTIVEPTAEQKSEKLTTWHMFADAASIQQMDIDSDKQDRTIVPNNARVAIYDASTSNYYDYVRIDLRGNTSAGFYKKSHGLRFAKAHPLTTYDCVSGQDVEEIRKSSLIAEWADPTFMRQMASFWLLNRNGSPAPFDFPVRCNLNGEFFQLAFHSERFTDELIEDVYGLDKFGYSYKEAATWNGSRGEKKTPDDENESDRSVLQKFTKLLPSKVVETDTDHAKYSKIAAENMDLAAWFNYMALTRITQETDDIWANIGAYLDDPAMIEGHRGTGTWRPLAYDMNLSFGQWYKQVTHTGLMADEDWFKCHPFYGGHAIRAYNDDTMQAFEGNPNNAYEAIYQSEKFRRLYLRRLRTLMDKELGAPNAEETLDNSTIPFIVFMREMKDLIAADAELDRQKWGYGSGTIISVWKEFPPTVEAGLEDLWTNYVVPRREHLYVTHSIDAANVGYGSTFAAGIPHMQSAIADLREGITAEYDARLGAVVIRNANEETIDLSDWELSGPVTMTLPAGTVIDQAMDGVSGEVYVTADRRATVAAMAITDQVIVGNGEAGKGDAKITLTAADGTKVIFEPSPAYNFLRLHSFDGITPTADGDTDEWITLTNLSNEVALDLAGVKVVFLKDGDPLEEAKCVVTFEAGTTLAAGSSLMLKQSDFDWKKITNGKLNFYLTDADGMSVQSLYINQKDAAYAKYYGAGGPGGAFYLQATTFAQDSETFIEVAYPVTDPEIRPEEGTIEKGEEAGTWVVTPVEGTNAVTVANLPDDGILVVPSVIEKVTGAADDRIRVVNKDAESEKSFDVTAAFTITGGAIELNRDAAVGGVTVTPEIKVVAEVIDEPFTLGDNGGEVTVQTIPGLTYLLVRGTDVRAIDDVRASKMATDVTLTLVDELKQGESKPSCAFYVIRVSR